MKRFFNSRSIFFGSLILCVILFYCLSQNFFLTNYHTIESIQNEKHINNLLKHINTEIQQVDKVANTFIYNGFNIATISEIEMLGLDFIVYKNIKDGAVFSRYNYNNDEIIPLIKNKTSFENNLIELFKQQSYTADIYTYKNRIFYLIKKQLNPTAFIYLGKNLNNNSLQKLSEDFAQLNITHEQITQTTLKLSTRLIENIFVQTSLEARQIINNISFYNHHDEYLFSIKTINPRKFVNEGEKTIQIVNAIMGLFLAVILYIIYKTQMLYRRVLQKDKKILESKVEKRTKQLESLLKKVKKSNEQLHYLAYSDPLTKTHNRRSFFIESEKVLKQAQEDKSSVALVMIDIDNFKQINDKYGHNIGDKVLVAFASMIKDEIGEDDIFGRLGGEEFAVVFPNTELDDANKKVENLRKMVANLEIKLKCGHRLKFTASFGLNDNSLSHNIDEILKNADELLYSAKHSGKNLVRSRINQTALWCDLY